MTRVRGLPVLLLAVSLLAVPGCGGAGTATSPTVAVYAAASLQEVFTELAEVFEADHPDATVQLTFAGSADLVTQLIQGARAEVFAAADEANMDRAAEAGLLAGPAVPFTANTLTVVTAPDNPHRIGSFADLARPDLAVVTCAPQVPCGAATQRLERQTGVDLEPVSEEGSVTDVLHKVTSGQADAGVVYRTDARRAGEEVHTVADPAAAAVSNRYPIAVLAEAAHPDLAAQFVELATGPQGQKVLSRYGFVEAR